MPYFDFHHHHFSSSGIKDLPLFHPPVDQGFSVSIHPHELENDINKAKQWVKELSTHPNCLAIGETGLDGIIETSFDFQKEIFQWHINLANRLEKPIIVHCVKYFHLLPQFIKGSNAKMIVHGFRKNRILGQQLLDAGYYLSFGKPLLRDVSLQTFVSEVPMEKIFLETDDDDQTSIELIYEKVASLKNISTKSLTEQIRKNLREINIR